MKTASLIFFLLAIASIVIGVISSINDNNHGVVTGLIGTYGNLILSKIHNKND